MRRQSICRDLALSSRSGCFCVFLKQIFHFLQHTHTNVQRLKNDNKNCPDVTDRKMKMLSPTTLPLIYCDEKV